MTTATATAPQSENLVNGSDVNSKTPVEGDGLSKQTPASPGGGVDESKGESDAPVARTSVVLEGGVAVTDVQKKMKRAERFGLPVQMTEEEKRNSRAERFGPGSAVKGSDTRASEDLKRKARAERFGIVESGSADEETKKNSTDEETKKKARLARFNSKPKTDSVEEDKKRARALRFSLPNSSSKPNGKGDIEKADIAGKASAGT